jgi:nucleotide-binding universal stress UspA family protein
VPDYAQDRVIAGVDSADRTPIIEAAVQEARRSGAGLTIVHAFEMPVVFGMQAWDGGFQDAVDASSAALQALTEDVRRDNPGVDVRCELLVGPAAYELIKASRTARLIVVGCRGVGGFEELMLGSVSSQVAAHAHCPVIVLRPADARTHATGPVVVGVDGSPSSDAAVRFAFAEAAGRDATLIAIHTWSPASLISGGGLIVPVDSAEEEADAQAVLDRALSAVDTHFPQVAVDRRLVEQTFVEQVFIDASAHASLVVVGSRGRGGVAGVMLGSVSQALLHRGHCPIAVVHER